MAYENLQTALQARIAALGADADPKVLLLLAKALEAAVGPINAAKIEEKTLVGVISVEQARIQGQEALNATRDQCLQAIDDALAAMLRIRGEAGDALDTQLDDALSAIAQATAAKLAEIAAAGGGPALVRAPAVTAPANGATGTSCLPQISTAAFGSVYGASHAGTQIQIATDAAFVTVVQDSGWLGATTQYQTTQLTASRLHYVRARHRDSDGVVSPWGPVSSFTTGEIVVVTPTLTAPAGGSTVSSTSPLTLTGAAFTATNGADTHSATDWEIWDSPNGRTTGVGTLVWTSSNDSVNKTSIAVPANTLPASKTYYASLRYRGALAGPSAWSAPVQFSTAAINATGPQSQLDPNKRGATGITIATIPGSSPNAAAWWNTSETYASVLTTQAISAGKIYFEEFDNYPEWGIRTGIAVGNVNLLANPAGSAGYVVFENAAGKVFVNGADPGYTTVAGTTMSGQNRLGFAINFDTKMLFVRRAGTWFGDPVAGTGGVSFAALTGPFYLVMQAVGGTTPALALTPDLWADAAPAGYGTAP